MPLINRTIYGSAVIMTIVAGFGASHSVRASALVTLHSFAGSSDGATPQAALTLGADDHLYGTTVGNLNNGGKAASSVFELAPPTIKGGTWTERTLSSFPGGAVISGPAVLDGSGRVYSTTLNGGAYGGGSVFELIPPARAGQAWSGELLASFEPIPTSGKPREPVSAVFSPSGSLIGASVNAGLANCEGGVYLCGTIWQLTPSAKPGAQAQKTTIYQLPNETDGAFPAGDLVFNDAGNAFGTAGGGLECYHSVGILHSDCGQVIVLKAPEKAGAPWTESVAYDFNPHPDDDMLPGPDGAFPNPGLILDAAGNLYGTTQAGGSGRGIIFKLSPPAHDTGSWTETILYTFTVADGSPMAPVTFDSHGNLYGTTYDGGNGYGIIFRLAPPPRGSSLWTRTTLYSFAGKGDGKSPMGGLVVDGSGNLFGTTSAGGTAGHGTVFEFVP